jgi:hypothetical protein
VVVAETISERPLSFGGEGGVRGAFGQAAKLSRPPHPALRADLSPEGEVIRCYGLHRALSVRSHLREELLDNLRRVRRFENVVMRLAGDDGEARGGAQGIVVSPVVFWARAGSAESAAVVAARVMKVRLPWWSPPALNT